MVQCDRSGSCLSGPLMVHRKGLFSWQESSRDESFITSAGSEPRMMVPCSESWADV